MRTIENSPRGCGSLRRGKCYVQGSVGEGGTLQSWTWILGEQIPDGKHNFYASIPPRRMLIADFPTSLIASRIVVDSDRTFNEIAAEREIPSTARYNAASLPRFALFDHVGSSYYSPSSFALECQYRGASRTVPRSMAKDVAKLLRHFRALPIVFTSSDVPLLEAEFVERFIQAVTFAEQDAVRCPTWFIRDWGLHRGKKPGWDHWAIDLMDSLHDKVVPDDIVPHVRFLEQVFGVSWITEAVFVINGDETPDDLRMYLEDGIEPVDIMEADDES